MQIFLKWPGNQNKNARSNNYISTQMQDRQGNFFVWHVLAPQTRMQGRTITSRYTCKAERRTFFFFYVSNVPAITTRMQGWAITPQYKCKTDTIILNKCPDNQTRLQGRTITYCYACKTDSKTYLLLKCPASKTSMQGRTPTSRYKCKTERNTFILCRKCPGSLNKNARPNNYISIQMQDR